MKSLFAATLAAVLLASPVLAPAQAAAPGIDVANAVFVSGRFDDAAKLYDAIIAADPKNFAALSQRGRVALYSNQLNDAERWLTQAHALRPTDPLTSLMLADVFYRRDDFVHAVAILKKLGPVDFKTMSPYGSLSLPKLESFGTSQPYQISGPAISHIKFVTQKVLPLVQVQVNGRTAVFFLDTGGAEIILDTQFAKELGVKSVGEGKGTFAGGQIGSYSGGRVESVKIGDYDIRNVPVQILATRQFSEGLGVKQVDGCIGTVMLYHFLYTFDYTHDELVLRRKTPQARAEFDATPGTHVTMPVWLSGDHFNLAWGRIMQLPPALFFVDTGLAGAGVNIPKDILDSTGIVLEKAKSETSSGAAGDFSSTPYIVPHVSLGDVARTDVPGVYNGPTDWEHAWGFSVGSMIGGEFVNHYALTFDYDKMQLIITKPD